MGFVEFITNNWIGLTVVAVVVLFIIYSEIRRKKRKQLAKKKTEQKVSEITKNNETIEKIEETNEPIVQTTKPSSEEFVFEETDEDIHSKKKDIIAQMNKMSGDIKIEKEDLDAETIQEYTRLRNELKITSKKKNEMRAQGLKLKELFDKYKEKESYLETTIKNVEKMIARRAIEREHKEPSNKYLINVVHPEENNNPYKLDE